MSTRPNTTLADSAETRLVVPSCPLLPPRSRRHHLRTDGLGTVSTPSPRGSNRIDAMKIQAKKPERTKPSILNPHEGETQNIKKYRIIIASTASHARRAQELARNNPTDARNAPTATKTQTPESTRIQSFGLKAHIGLAAKQSIGSRPITESPGDAEKQNCAMG